MQKIFPGDLKFLPGMFLRNMEVETMWYDNKLACDVFGLVYIGVLGGLIALMVNWIVEEIRERRIEK